MKNINLFVFKYLTKVKNYAFNKTIKIYVAFIKIAISRMIEITLLHFGKLNVNGLEV